MGSFTSQEGYRVSFNQLARRNNGITYKSGLRIADRINELLDANEKKDIVLKIMNCVFIQAISYEGKYCYLIFEPYEV